MRNRHAALLALALLSPVSLAAEPDEAPGDGDRVAPGPVAAAIRARLPEAAVHGVARREAPAFGELWEVEVREGHHARHLAFDPNGAAIGEREAVPPSAVDPQALDAVARRFGRAAIWHAERLQAGEDRGWALTFSRGDQLGEAVVDGNGRLLEATVRRG